MIKLAVKRKRKYAVSSLKKADKRTTINDESRKELNMVMLNKNRLMQRKIK
jgi:hypothetical protein